MALDSSTQVLQALFTKDRKPLARPILLARLAEKTGLPNAQVAQALVELRAKAWAFEENFGLWRATAEAKAGLPSPVKATRARASTSTAALGPMLREVLDRLSRLEAKVDRIEPKLDRVLAGPPVEAPRKVEPEEIRRAIRDHLRQLATDQRLRGIIPVGELRRRVTASTQADVAQIDAVLVEMDRAFELDLKVSNDPSVGPSIRVPGRGEAHFVVAR